MKPTAFGSSGGGGNGATEATGGGVLVMKARGKMIHDGEITVNGKDAVKNSGNGGGSGGSVFIETESFDGSGVIRAHGGAGGDSGGGGGSGGRIAVYYNSSFFSGSMSAYGGSSNSEAGAAGTIYKKNEVTDFSVLEVYNQGKPASKEEIGSYSDLRSDSARTWLISSSNSLVSVALDDVNLGATVYQGLVIDEVRLGGSAHLAIEPNGFNIRLHTFKKFYGTFEGNNFGFLHVGPNQLVSIPNTDYYIPVNLKIYQSGYMKLPNRVMLHKNSLSLDAGYLIGVTDLTISQCKVTFGDNSGALSTGTLQVMKFTFQTLTIMSQGSLEMTSVDAKYALSIESLVINAGGQMIGRNLTVAAKSATVDESGKISVDGGGQRCPVTNVYLAGSGGSHAGELCSFLFYLPENKTLCTYVRHISLHLKTRT